jgi:hypothetical protein
MAILVGPFTINRRQAVLYVPSLVVFAIANFVLYQPWHLDNTKVFNAGWIPFAVAVVAQAVARLRKFGAAGIGGAVILVVVMVASGTLAVKGAVEQGFPIWGAPRAVYAVGEFARVISPPKSVWITDSDHTNPVVTIAGRQTLAGYPGWLLSHGLNDTARTAAIRALSHSPEAVRLADKWGAEFVCVTEDGHSQFTFKPNATTSRNWKLVWDNRPYKVWQRVNATKPTPRPKS